MRSPETPVRVAIADDETLIATSLATLLSLEADIEVVATCSSGEELVNWVRVHPVDVCVVDLHMSGIDGVETTERLCVVESPATGGNKSVDGPVGQPRRGKGERVDEAEGIGVVIVTSHAQPQGLQRALAAGARGFVPKTASAQEFATAIRTVRAGRRYIDSQVAAAAFEITRSPLTQRERQLLELVPEGQGVEQLAAAVCLAPGTVRNYLSSAISKTGGANRFEAYKLAAERGWI